MSESARAFPPSSRPRFSGHAAGVARGLSRGFPGRTGRGAFSFVEIMFAVMILGIGFILVAGVFPVALSQTQASGDETIASSVAKEAADYVASLSNAGNLMIPDGTVHRFGPGFGASVPGLGEPDGALWNQVRGDLILPQDSRYAWVPFYLRNKDATTGQAGSSAQLIVIAVRARNHSAYTAADLTFTGNGTAARGTLMGRSATATFAVGATNNPDTITFLNFLGPDAGAVAPGTFVIIGKDQTPVASSAGRSVSANGWILKLGNKVSGNTWQLQPGGDLKNSPGYTPRRAICWFVGQGLDPSSGTFTGGTQDIMAYSTFIVLNGAPPPPPANSGGI